MRPVASAICGMAKIALEIARAVPLAHGITCPQSANANQSDINVAAIALHKLRPIERTNPGHWNKSAHGWVNVLSVEMSDSG